MTRTRTTLAVAAVALIALCTGCITSSSDARAGQPFTFDIRGDHNQDGSTAANPNRTPVDVRVIYSINAPVTAGSNHAASAVHVLRAPRSAAPWTGRVTIDGRACRTILNSSGRAVQSSVHVQVRWSDGRTELLTKPVQSGPACNRRQTG